MQQPSERFIENQDKTQDSNSLRDNPTKLSTDHSIFKKTEGYERPPVVQELVDNAFAILNKSTGSGYIYMGSHNYEYRFFERVSLDASSLIQSKLKTYSEDTPLYVLDVGAGDFTLVDSMQKLHGNKIKMYGITASDVSENTYKTMDEYHVIANAENLSKVFVTPSFDLIISSATFMHFKDPVGSLIETYEKLKPGGILLMDTLYIPGCENVLQKIIVWLQDKGYPVIAQCSSSEILSFVIQKPLDGTLQKLIFPVHYHSCADNNRISYTPDPDIFKKESTYLKNCLIEIQSIMDEANAIDPELALYDNLPDLLNDSKYQNLCLSAQLSLILAVGNSPVQSDFNVAYDKVKEAARSSYIFSHQVTSYIDTLGGLSIYNFYHGFQEYILKFHMSPDLQLACIRVAAKVELDKRMETKCVVNYLNQMNILFKNCQNINLLCNPNKKSDHLRFREIAEISTQYNSQQGSLSFK